MDFVSAIKTLVGNGDLIAVLPGQPGTVPALHMGMSMQISDVRTGKPHRYVPKYADLVSIEWEVKQLSVMRAQRQAAA